MVRRVEGIEYPITIPTGDAKKQVQDFNGYMEASSIRLSSVLRRTGVAALYGLGGAAGGFFQGTQQTLADPTQSVAANMPETLGTTGQGALTAAGATLGLPGIAAGYFLGEAFKNWLKGVFAKESYAQKAAVSAVQGIMQQYTAAGLKASDKEVAELLSRFQKHFERIYDGLEQVARVNDEMAKGVMGSVSRGVRRTQDYVR